ncbi:hypothetical protein DL93DRAFT_896311 [Clavulina sp. PMI_390]|nr:hypothetical protein DL93DRAFT_896311 [Clavulina sp. PMI_390]
MGPESWTRIGSPVVGLHFMYHVLDVDPVAYQSLKGCFIAIWAQSLILPRWSIQHLFTATLFCIDRLAHPFLRDIPCGNYDNHCNFGFSADSLAILRWQMLDAFITNIAQFLRQAEGTNPSTEIRMLCELGRSLMRALIDTVSAQFFAATNHVEQLRRLIDSIQRAGILPAREFAQRTTGIEYR